MRYPEKELIQILKKSGIDFTCSLPCEKIKTLLLMVEKTFLHLPLTREEEGAGICAGAALAGKRPVIFVQSSGLGNMLNALLSLTAFYEMPLAIFVSRRGVYQEKIAAQLPMGLRLPAILKGAGLSYSEIASQDDFSFISKHLPQVFREKRIHVFLLSPEIWEGSKCIMEPAGFCEYPLAQPSKPRIKMLLPTLTRFEILEIVNSYLDTAAVVCNLGFPSKELYSINHRPSHFYMLGSMGMATPIGLGIALSSKKQVMVIDGDGSILMNPGSLATAAYANPENLTIILIDNGAYGSTGNQPTLSRTCVDLEFVARGFGIRNTSKVATESQIRTALKNPAKGLKLVHILAVPGNLDLPNIPLTHLMIKDQVMEFLKSP